VLYFLGDVDGVEDENVMVVFGQRDDVSFGGDFEAAATRDFDVRTLELRGRDGVGGGGGDPGRGLVVDGDVELVAVRVSDEDVASVGDVNAVGEAGDVIGADLAQQLAVLVDNYNVVVPEIANVKVPLENPDVRRLLHEVAALVVPDELSLFAEDEDGWRD